MKDVPLPQLLAYSRHLTRDIAALRQLLLAEIEQAERLRAKLADTLLEEAEQVQSLNRRVMESKFQLAAPLKMSLETPVIEWAGNTNPTRQRGRRALPR